MAGQRGRGHGTLWPLSALTRHLQGGSEVPVRSEQLHKS